MTISSEEAISALAGFHVGLLSWPGCSTLYLGYMLPYPRYLLDSDLSGG